MYVPIMKNRLEEMKVCKELNYCFSENIIPLFEIIDEKYETKYLINPTTGKPIMEYKEGNERKSKKKLPKTKEDIITLELIKEIMENKQAFIDYYRFPFGNGKGKVDVSKAMLSWELSNDYSQYINKVLEIGLKFSNFIPVLSIKDNFNIEDNELEIRITELKSINKVIAIRITDRFLNDKIDIINKLLDENDYILYDIGKQNIKSKIMELEEIEEYNIKAKLVLLNCPRDEKNSNGEYEEEGKTILIDNSAVNMYKEYSFYGVGDYAGLKGTMPEKGGGNGKGCALALLYNFPENIFYSFANRDSNKWIKGYREVIERIKKYEKTLNTDNDCPAFMNIHKLENEEKTGSFSTWVNICLKRYIYQIYKSKV